VPLLLWFTHWKPSRTLALAVRVSKAVLTVDRRSFPMASEKVVAIGHGIDVSRFACVSREPAARLRVVALGRTSPAKGFETIVRAAALAVASLAVPIRLFRPRDAGGDAAALGSGANSSPSQGAGATSAPTGPASTAPAGGATPTPTAPGGPVNALTVASISAVDQAGAKRFRVPATAPASLPAGDPGIIVKLSDGSYVAYDATCTHEGCRVGWDAQDSVLLCPCHGAAFDPANHGAVLGGPTNQPLLELPIVVDHAAGTITLQA